MAGKPVLEGSSKPVPQAAKTPVFATALLALLILCGVWLSGLIGGDMESDENLDLGVIRALLGLIMVLGATIGLFSIWGRKSAPCDDRQRAWKLVREKGKKHYIVAFTIRSAVLIIVSLALLIIFDYWSGTSVTTAFVAMIVVGIGLIPVLPYLASRIWDKNEVDFTRSRKDTDNTA
jgi:uncharacterized Tic20 family protein